MQFIKYPSIDTSTQNKFSKNRTADKWVVTEKVHGANIGIYLDLCNIGGQDWIQFAKRTGFLTPEDKNQFPVDSWLDDNRGNLEQVAHNVVKHLDTELTPGTYLVIFGEFYGGWYPANPVGWMGSNSLPAELKTYSESHEGARPRPVQWDVYYAPTHGIVCFDMVIITPGFQPVKDDGTPVLASEVIRYQNWLSTEFVRSQPIPQVPLMFTGTLAECVEFANSEAKYVNSLVPVNIHGCQPLSPGTNIIEGVVISPASGAHFTYKIKNNAFQETVNIAHIPKKERGPNSGHPFLTYLTLNRWNATRSKYGAVSINELKAAFVKDALADFAVDNPDSKPVDVSSRYIRDALDKFYASLEGELDESITK